MKLHAARVLTSAAVIAMTHAAAAQDLFVAPARFSVLQVLFDVLRLRPAGLVAYQGNATTERPALHAWNGQEWVTISLESFRDGSFAAVRPQRIALLGDGELLPPVLAAAAQQMAPVVVNWTDLDNASIVNAAGRWLQFSAREWSWIAGRYNMNMADANEGRRRDSWYYHPHPELRRGLGREAPPAAPRREGPEPASVLQIRDSSGTLPPPVVIPPDEAAARRPPAASAEPPPAFAPNTMWEKPDAPAPRREAEIK